MGHSFLLRKKNFEFRNSNFETFNYLVFVFFILGLIFRFFGFVSDFGLEPLRCNSAELSRASDFTVSIFFQSKPLHLILSQYDTTSL